MFVQSQIKISASKEKVWNVISNIENAADVFSDIKNIQIVDRPQNGLIGLRWKEIREFMGKDAEETMWITDAVINKFYTSEAKNSGCLYHSSLVLEECDEGVWVSKTFKSTPETFLAKILAPMMRLMQGTMRKCLARDLEDIKNYCEKIAS